MNKLLVYTCVTHGYDNPQRPSTLPDWADWLLYTDNDFSDDRYPKLMPHEVLPQGYEYSLWLDGNIDIQSGEFWDRIQELMDDGCLYAGLHHPVRNNVYKESIKILRCEKEQYCNIRKTLGFLLNEGFPSKFGMMNENCIILRRHSAPEVIEFQELWWNTFKACCRRDQMTWGYCIWKTSLRNDHIFPRKVDIRHHPWFRYTVHDPICKKRFVKDVRKKSQIVYLRIWILLKGLA